jgi:hypothetical protein
MGELAHLVRWFPLPVEVEAVVVFQGNKQAPLEDREAAEQSFLVYLMEQQAYLEKETAEEMRLTLAECKLAGAEAVLVGLPRVNRQGLGYLFR